MSEALTPEQWTQLEELFELATAVPPEEHAAWTCAHCAADPQMEAELLSLLRASGEPLAALLQPAQDAAQHLLDDDNAFSCIGPYRLVRLLGEGGMGIAVAWPRALQRKRTMVSLVCQRNDIPAGKQQTLFNPSRLCGPPALMRDRHGK